MTHEKKQVQITVTLDSELKDKVLNMCRQCDLNASQFMRRLIRSAIKKYEEKINEQAGKGAQTDTEGEAYQ